MKKVVSLMIVFAGLCCSSLVCAVSPVSPESAGEKPEVRAASMGGSAYEIVLSGFPQASQVRVLTWTEINGQDDLVWYEARKAGDGSWIAEIDTSRHGGGSMISHV